MDEHFNDKDIEQVDKEAEPEKPQETMGAVSNGKGNAPEPPSRWRLDASYESKPGNTTSQPSSGASISGMMGTTKVVLQGEEALEFQSARRFVTVSQVIALVSLFIGGIFASGVAVACACYAYGKLNRIGQAHPDQPDLLQAFQRTGRMAVGVAVVALAINAVTLVLLYPYVMDMMQSGDFGSLMGTSQSSGSGSGSVTWG